jgi:hypothetical protein
MLDSTTLRRIQLSQKIEMSGHSRAQGLSGLLISIDEENTKKVELSDEKSVLTGFFPYNRGGGDTSFRSLLTPHSA